MKQRTQPNWKQLLANLIAAMGVGGVELSIARHRACKALGIATQENDNEHDESRRDADHLDRLPRV